MLHLLRRAALAALATASFFTDAGAQVVTVTAGTSISALSPINHASSEGAFEVIYVQPSINQAGLITRLAFEKSDGTELSPLTGVSIYLKTTTATGFADGPLDTLSYQRVYAGNFPNATPQGYQEITLRTPFTYANTPGLNLSVLVLRRGGNVQATIGPRARYVYGITTNPIRIACRRYTGTAPVTATTTLTATNILPNLRLTFGTPSATARAGTGPRAELYPVPADAIATLSAPGWSGALHYSVQDALGRTVRASTPLPAAADGRYPLAFSDLPAGTYYLHLRGAARHEVLRLVRR